MVEHAPRNIGEELAEKSSTEEAGAYLKKVKGEGMHATSGPREIGEELVGKEKAELAEALKDIGKENMSGIETAAKLDTLQNKRMEKFIEQLNTDPKTLSAANLNEVLVTLDTQIKAVMKKVNTGEKRLLLSASYQENLKNFKLAKKELNHRKEEETRKKIAEAEEKVEAWYRQGNEMSQKTQTLN